MRTNITPPRHINKLTSKGADKIFAGVKNYGKNVLGGAKIVGSTIRKVIQYPARQIEKEWRGEDNAIEDFRKKQKQSGWTK